MTAYERLFNQVKALCPESHAEYLVDFPCNPFESWFYIAKDGKTICRDKRRYDYCMLIAEEAIRSATCEELVDVLYFISNEVPGGNWE